MYTKFSICNSFQVTSDFTHHLATGLESQFTHYVVAMEKVAEKHILINAENAILFML